MTTVVVTNPMHEAGLEELASEFDVRRLWQVSEPADRATILRSADVLVVRMQVTASVLDQCPRLRLVVKHGSGVDSIDFAAARDRGVVVVSTPAGPSRAVAEGAVALMLAVVRRIPEMDTLMRQDGFSRRWSLELADISGAALGLVGFGRIARQTAQICRDGFHMKIRAFDPNVGAEEMRAAATEKVDTVAELMALSDVISIHAPLTAETYHLIGTAELAAAKDGAVIVNTSRGGLIDEPALIAALKSGRISGAGLDVMETEPPPRDHPLLALDNVVLSPHVGGATHGGLRGTSLAVAAAVKEFFESRQTTLERNR